MRLFDFLNALFFRGVQRITSVEDSKRVRVGTTALLSVCRPNQTFTFPDDMKSWPRAMYDFQAKHTRAKFPPYTLLRRTWEETKGGLGARDVWDIMHTVGKHEKHSKAFDVAACMPTMAQLALGGRYGLSVASALRSAYHTHLPCANFESIARAQQSSHIDSLVRQYVSRLLLGITLSEEEICAGIINHFLNVNKFDSATKAEVVHYLSMDPEESLRYLKNCLEAGSIDVTNVHGSKSVVSRRENGVGEFSAGIMPAAVEAERRWESNFG